MLKKLLSKIQEEKIISEKIFENLDADSFWNYEMKKNLIRSG